MKIRKITLIMGLCAFLAPKALLSQDCGIENWTFKFHERIDYTINYYLAGIWVSAGEVYFKVDSTHLGRSDYYHFESYGKTFSKYDWVYKVRDKYESYLKVSDFTPLRFKRNVNEGSSYIREDYLFNHGKKEVYTVRKLEEDAEFEKDTVQIEGCGYDVLSMIYYARNIDFNGLEIDDKLPIKIFLDNEMHESYIRYLGKEELKVKGFGTFKCIKFSPLLIEGTIFNAGEDMTVYVTDDLNRIPLLIETPILVGSIRARISNVEGLRHPLESLIGE